MHVFIAFESHDEQGRPTRDGALARGLSAALGRRGIGVGLAGGAGWLPPVPGLRCASSGLIVIATARSDLESPPMRAAWEPFINSSSGGVGSDSRIILYLEDLRTADLPAPLSGVRILRHREGEFDRVAGTVSRILSGEGAGPQPSGGAKLRLVANAPPRSLAESVRVVESARGSAPFAVQAMVFEEDTSLVLSADPQVRDPGEHPVRIMTSLFDHRPETPGRVLVRGREPYRVLAIVHDLGEEPTWREEWVVAALEGVLSVCTRLRIEAIGLEPLGSRHGRLPLSRFRELLRGALSAAPPGELQRIWVVLPG